MEIDYGELKNDTNLVTKSENLQAALEKIDERISAVCDFPNYDNLSTEEKVKYDLFLSYSINSLFWILCKLQAIESPTEQIKNEMSRVRQAMMRDKEIYERKTKRPILDKGAAGRFIRHGLWDPNKPKDRDLIGPKANKRKLEEI